VNPAVVAAVLARSGGRCEWCAYRRELELHHVTPKGMGGRRRTKEASDSPGNLVQLCRVCHGAAHHQTLTLADGHGCARCYLRERCPHSRAPGPGPLRASRPGTLGPAGALPRPA
jgi:HNH endonuclease